MFRDFISELGKRLYTENNLSDITWALLKSSADFPNVFLPFIGINNMEMKYPFEFEREYLLGGNLRVDLAIRSHFTEVFVENKIWDTNYHFDDYPKAIRSSNKSSLVLISAHEIDPSVKKRASEKGWTLKYWHEFEERLCSLTFEEFDDVRTGFINYLRRVCMIRPVDKIHFDGESLLSLYSFNNLIRRIVQKASNDNFTYALYPCSRSFSENYSACYYNVARRGEEEKEPFTYPAIGIDYEKLTISIWLDRDWNKIATNVLTITPKKTAWFETEKESAYVAFYLLPELFDKFNAGGKTEQFSLLLDFFRNTNVYIEKAIEDTRKRSA